MASAGPNAPGTMASTAGEGTRAWASPNNAKVSDGTSTIASSISGAAISHDLIATAFGFAIPAGSTINGVSVTYRRYKAQTVSDRTVKLVKSGVISGNNKAGVSWDTSLRNDSYGGASDLWGLSLSVDDVNSSTFGVSLTANITQSGKTNANAYVDFISITVTYTEGGGGASAVPVIMNQYRQRRA